MPRVPMWLSLIVFCLFANTVQIVAQEGTGVLLFDLKEYSSASKIKEKTARLIRAKPIPWSVIDNTLVIIQVNRDRLTPEQFNETYYGKSTRLQLAEGEYNVACAGLNPTSGSQDIYEVLSQDAFFNLDVVQFNIVPDEVTVLELHPELKGYEAAGLRYWVPEIHIFVMKDGIQESEGVLCRRAADAIAWDDYRGPLKPLPSEGELRARKKTERTLAAVVSGKLVNKKDKEQGLKERTLVVVTVEQWNKYALSKNEWGGGGYTRSPVRFSRIKNRAKPGFFLSEIYDPFSSSAADGSFEVVLHKEIIGDGVDFTLISTTRDGQLPRMVYWDREPVRFNIEDKDKIDLGKVNLVKHIFGEPIIE